MPPGSRAKVEAAVAAVLPGDTQAAMYLSIMLGIEPADDRAKFVAKMD